MKKLCINCLKVEPRRGHLYCGLCKVLVKIPYNDLLAEISRRGGAKVL